MLQFRSVTLMHSAWKVLPRKSDDLIRQLLYNRNLRSRGDIERFFDPRLEDYEAEFNIPGLEKAVARIRRAIRKKELVVVYGDYDVDGLCASAIAYLGLAPLGLKILPFIPHRDREGYGLSRAGLDKAKGMGAFVVLTVDNGITALEQAEYAKSIGLELIITDHHEPLEAKPVACSIVHSMQMSGAGVAWCLVKKLIGYEQASDLTQFVALATIADIIPILGVNRAFVVQGLRVLNETKNVGLRSLIIDSGLQLGAVGSYEVGFVLGPRLNAVGRLEHAIDGLRLLCTKDATKARKLAGMLSVVNARRQKLTEDGVLGAKVMVSGEKNVYVLESREWLPGVIGLIASKLCDEYGRPVVAIASGEKISKGSARSSESVNITDALRKCKHLLVNVGGHSKAAGFTIETEKIADFRKCLEAVLRDLPAKAEKVLEIEAEIHQQDLTEETAEMISAFEPFGLGNPKPVLMCGGMKISDIRVLSGGKHLKFRAEGIDAIAFGMGEMHKSLHEGQKADVAFCLEINKFNGRESLQLKIKDMRFI